jgi:voltage-gated potassium channel Kch
VIVGIIVVGRLLLRHALRWIAKSRSTEIFTAASLALVVGIASLMQAVGLSMALGAFLGGVLLAESEYKRELETDVEPFKGLLLGLFFMAVGMSMDFQALRADWALVLGVLAGFLAIKGLVLWSLATAVKVPLAERPVFALLLAQGGEFAFVVFQQAEAAQILSSRHSAVLIGTVALSMRLAGAEQARVLVLAIDDVAQSIKLAEVAREHFPHLTVVARARNVQHYYALRDRGVELIERETLDSALMSGRSVLESLGWHPHHARQLAMRFRQHTQEQIAKMYPHHQDEQALVSMAKQGRQQLEELFAQERAALAQGRPQGWEPEPH